MFDLCDFVNGDSSVNIVYGYELNYWVIKVRSPAEKKGFFL
jgi:hypothetical protein